VIRRRIRPTRKQRGCELHLPEEERQLLEQLPGQLAAAIRHLDVNQPVPDGLRRLFPIAYSRDEEAQRAYADATRGELVELHLASLDALSRHARSRRLDEQTMTAWLHALTDLRLVLGTVLGVTDDEVGVPEGAPRNEVIIYQYLTILEAELIDVMEQWLPEPLPGADDRVPDDPWGEPLGDLRWDGTPRPEWPPRPEW
jgi:hypothetical protein